MAMRIARSSVKGMRHFGQRSVLSGENDSMPSAMRSSMNATVSAAWVEQIDVTRLAAVIVADALTPHRLQEPVCIEA